MTPGSDIPGNRSSGQAQPHEQGDGALRTVSADELAGVLQAHQRWLETGGREGERADLAHASLRSADLRDANLQGARLARADFSCAILVGARLDRADLSSAVLIEADLSRASFNRARLQGADLTNAKGFSGDQLAGADVSGARLPADLQKLDSLQMIEETSRKGRAIFLFMLLGCAYSWLTIVTTTDARLLTDSATSPLPLIRLNIELADFYGVMPLILAGLLLWLHVTLLPLWEGFAGLPVRFPDGRRLDEHAHPWLLNALTRRQFALFKKRAPIDHLEEWASIFLAWWVVPLTLFGFWLRYLPRYERFDTWLHIGLLTAAAAAGIAFYRAAAIKIKGSAGETFRWKSCWRDRRVYEGLSLVLLLGVLGALSYGVFNGKRSPAHLLTYSEYRQGTLNEETGLAGFLHAGLGQGWDSVPWALAQLGYSPFADLREKDVSIRPANYLQIDARERNRHVTGANLRGRDLRYADAAHEFLVNADMGAADLRHASLASANLQGAILEGANLPRADLEGADLENADLGGARLQKARLGKANLQKARLTSAKAQKAFLEGANLQGANLEGANLRKANLTQVNLRKARLEDAILQRADLKQANLQGARLGSANLQDGKLWVADLREADLASANLRRANLSRANLRKANLRGAKLQGADLERANLRGADLEGARGLAQEQLDPACGDAGTKLPPGLTIRPCAAGDE
jgi:uncharacterized protein YjbI with pentapeptide repeats